jgi:hypothetical protein
MISLGAGRAPIKLTKDFVFNAIEAGSNARSRNSFGPSDAHSPGVSSKTFRGIACA